MASLATKNTIFNTKTTSAVPTCVTGQDVVHELSSMDLVMKLHYIKGLYFFKGSAVAGLTMASLKECMFKSLNLCYRAAGRIRKSDSGRPFIKCNDSGVRILEARSEMTVDECLETKNDSLHFDHLCPIHVLGPELHFSPLVFTQFTLFKCGGMSLGLSWSHLLGDAFSASTFMNTWAQVLSGTTPPPKSLNLLKSETKSQNPEIQSSDTKFPIYVKQIQSVGDTWIAENNCKMQTHSLQITATQLNQLQSKISKPDQTGQIPPFEALCAVIWHCLAKIRESSDLTKVTICRTNSDKTEDGFLGNNQIQYVVEAETKVAFTDPSELAVLITEQHLMNSKNLTFNIEGDQVELLDFIVYGANMTFVNLEDMNLYGLELNGSHRPDFANYKIDGVGCEGVVLVLPGPENCKQSGCEGRTVTLTLPETQMVELRNVLNRDWCIV